METCGNCQFFLRDEDREAIGVCRRYPQTVYVEQDDSVDQAWPTMLDDEWCGEWKKSDTKQEASTP